MLTETTDMDGIILLLLLLSGLCSLSSCEPHHRYVHFKSPLTWYGAQSYCRERCLDLATMDDISEMESALETMQDQHGDAVWIGLWKGSTAVGHWSLADKHFYNDGERNYMISGVTENCGFFLGSKVVTYPCTIPFPSLCFDGRKQGRDQYVLNPQALSWTEARDHCRTHHTDLSSVRNDAELQMIQEVAGDQPVWVGLYTDAWEWSDQTYSSLRYWEPNQEVDSGSQNTCGALLKSASGRWGERPCSETHQFLCNCPIVSFIKLRISSEDSALDLNKPAVQDNILKQIKEELRKSMPDVVQINWKKHPDGRVFIKQPRRSG